MDETGFTGERHCYLLSYMGIDPFQKEKQKDERRFFTGIQGSCIRSRDCLTNLRETMKHDVHPPSYLLAADFTARSPIIESSWPFCSDSRTKQLSTWDSTLSLQNSSSFANVKNIGIAAFFFKNGKGSRRILSIQTES